MSNQKKVYPGIKLTPMGNISNITEGGGYGRRQARIEARREARRQARIEARRAARKSS